MVESALEAGYRHIDGAAGTTTAGVGRSAEKRGFTQGEKSQKIWVTKAARLRAGARFRAQRRSTASLACCSSIMWTWQRWHGRRRSTGVPVRLGRRSTNSRRAVRTFGVCNFLHGSILSGCISETGEYPVVDCDRELHPTWQQREVVAWLRWRMTSRS